MPGQFLTESILHSNDLWSKTLNNLDLLNSKEVKLTALSYNRANQKQKIHFSAVLIQKLKEPNLTLPSQRLWSSIVIYQVSRQSAQWFWGRVLKGFTIYEYGGHLGHVTWNEYINILSPFTRNSRTDFGAGCVQLWIRSAEPPGEHLCNN